MSVGRGRAAPGPRPHGIALHVARRCGEHRAGVFRLRSREFTYTTERREGDKKSDGVKHLYQNMPSASRGMPFHESRGACGDTGTCPSGRRKSAPAPAYMRGHERWRDEVLGLEPGRPVGRWDHGRQLDAGRRKRVLQRHGQGQCWPEALVRSDGRRSGQMLGLSMVGQRDGKPEPHPSVGERPLRRLPRSHRGHPVVRTNERWCGQMLGRRLVGQRDHGWQLYTCRRGWTLQWRVSCQRRRRSFRRRLHVCDHEHRCC